MFRRQILRVVLSLSMGPVVGLAQEGLLPTTPESSSASHELKPISSKGIFEVQNGTVDAVHSTVSLAYPLGPTLPGRIPAGFSYFLKDWRGDNLRDEGVGSFQPIIWPRPNGEVPMLTPTLGYRSSERRIVRIFGEEFVFAPLSAPLGPAYYSNTKVLSWFSNRGVVPPASVGYSIIFASSDGTSFYLEGYANNPLTTNGMMHVDSDIVFRALLQNDRVIWWDQAVPARTQIKDIWGGKVSVLEFYCINGAYYSATIQNDLAPSERIDLNVTAIGAIQVGGHLWGMKWDGTPQSGAMFYPFPPGYPTPGALPYIISPSISMPPFESLAARVKVEITNTLGIRTVSLTGEFNAEADWFPMDDHSEHLPHYFANKITGKIRQFFRPLELTSGTAVTKFNWAVESWSSPPSSAINVSDIGLRIDYPSGKSEQFDTAVRLNLPMWRPDTYWVGILDDNPPNVPQPLWGGNWDGSTPGVFNMGAKNGIIKVSRKDENGNGDTFIITQVLPRYTLTGTSTLDASIVWQSDKHVTNVLQYATPQVTTSSLFRGTRLVHSKDDIWTMHAGCISQEQEIYGFGAPYNDTGDRTVYALGKDWEPTGYTVDWVTTYSGYRFKSWLNPNNIPWYFGNPIPGEVIRTYRDAALNIDQQPGTATISGDYRTANSWDQWGPVRQERHVVWPGGTFVSNSTLNGTEPWTTSHEPCTAITGNGYYAFSGQGDVIHTDLEGRVWDDMLGRLMTTSSSATISGSKLATLLPGVGVSNTLNQKTVQHDSLGRETVVSTQTGNQIKTENFTYSGTNPNPDSIINYLTSPQLTSPTFSGGTGKSFIYGPAPHYWAIYETDSLTTRAMKYERNLRGQITKSTDLSSGVVIEFEYDDLGRLSKTTRAAKGAIPALVKSFSFDEADRWKQETVVIQGNALVTRTEFDAFGRITKVIHPDGSYEASKYDNWGEKVAQSPRLRAQEQECYFTFSYDWKGRLTGMQDPWGRDVKSYPVEPAWKTIQVTDPAYPGFTISGVVSTEKDDRGNPSSEIHDLLGNRVAQIDAAGHLTKFSFDVYGHLIQSENAGQIRKYTVNELGWLLSMEEPETGLTEFSSFTALGAPRQITKKGRDRSGLSGNDSIALLLDSKHRLVDLTATSNMNAQVHRVVNQYREDFNLPVSISETQMYGTIQESYDYDEVGRIKQKVISDGDNSFTVKQSLDEGGNLLSLTYPSGGGKSAQVETIEYDSSLRQKQAKLDGVLKGIKTYGSGSGTQAVDTLTLGNGVNTTSTYSRGELIQSEHDVVPSPMLPAGVVRSPITWSAGGLMLSRGNDQFQYDALQRLSFALTNGWSGEVVNQWFNYDRFGNRTQSDFTFSTPVGGVAKPDELRSWRGAYDARNNIPAMITSLNPGSAKGDPNGGSIAGGLQTQASTDNLGRLKSIASVPGSPIESTQMWQYDALGRIISTANAQAGQKNFLLDISGLRFRAKPIYSYGEVGTQEYIVYGFNQEPLTTMESKLQSGTKGLRLVTVGGVPSSASVGDVDVDGRATYEFGMQFLAPAGAFVHVQMVCDDGTTFDDWEVGTGSWSSAVVYFGGDGAMSPDEQHLAVLTIESPLTGGSEVLVDNCYYGRDDQDGSWAGFAWKDYYENGWGDWTPSGPSATLVTESSAPPAAFGPVQYFGQMPGLLAWSENLIYGFGSLLSEERPTETVFVQGDQVGSPNIMTDTTGHVVGLSKNLPYGERFVSLGESSKVRFTTHLDQPGSVIHMQARDYMPFFGRFAQTDPGFDQKILKKDSWNLYSYVANNPVTRTDPTGMEMSVGDAEQLDAPAPRDQGNPNGYEGEAGADVKTARDKDSRKEEGKIDRSRKLGGKGRTKKSGPKTDLPEKVKPKREDRARVIYGETRALTPQKDAKGKVDPESEKNLAKARTLIGEVSKVNKDVHSETEPRKTNIFERRAWNASASAADQNATLPAGVRFFFIRQDGIGKQEPTQKDYGHDEKPSMSFGPFVKQWGGGDVPKGNAVYIDFYKERRP